MSTVALCMTDDSMRPRVRQGWFAVCDEEEPADVGDTVAVLFKTGRRGVLELVVKDGLGVTLEALKSGKRFRYQWTEIEQLCGVVAIFAPDAGARAYPQSIPVGVPS